MAGNWAEADEASVLICHRSSKVRVLIKLSDLHLSKLHSQLSEQLEHRTGLSADVSNARSHERAQADGCLGINDAGLA